jgi:hypothetical protein
MSDFDIDFSLGSRSIVSKLLPLSTLGIEIGVAVSSVAGAVLVTFFEHPMIAINASMAIIANVIFKSFIKKTSSVAC